MFVDEAQPMVRNAMFFAVAMTVPFSFASCCLRRGPEQHKILELRLSIQEGNAGGGSQRRMFCMRESLLLRRLTINTQVTTAILESACEGVPAESQALFKQVMIPAGPSILFCFCLTALLRRGAAGYDGATPRADECLKK